MEGKNQTEIPDHLSISLSWMIIHSLQKSNRNYSWKLWMIISWTIQIYPNPRSFIRFKKATCFVGPFCDSQFAMLNWSQLVMDDQISKRGSSPMSCVVVVNFINKTPDKRSVKFLEKNKLPQIPTSHTSWFFRTRLITSLFAKPYDKCNVIEKIRAVLY